MKKIVTIFLVAVLVVSAIALVGCSSKKEPVEEPAVQKDAEPELTVEDAVADAQEKVSDPYSGYSEKGVIEYLEGKGHSTEDATYAVQNIDVDWNEQAVKFAEAYMRRTSLSGEKIVEQLMYEGFTGEQAVYAALELGL